MSSDRWPPTRSRDDFAGALVPDPDRVELYDAFHQHYRALYASTVETAHFLAEQQRRADI